jgi:hypothetical protein
MDIPQLFLLAFGGPTIALYWQPTLLVGGEAAQGNQPATFAVRLNSSYGGRR